MKKPQFRLTGKVDLDLLRYPLPTYVKGKLVQPAPVTVRIKANVQPLVKSSGTQLLPEEAKVKKAVILWSADEIREKIENGPKQQADEFIWEGEKYRVSRSVNYSMGVLNHWEAIAFIIDPV